MMVEGPVLDRISYEAGYIAAMMAVWQGFYATSEPALRIFVDRAWKATGAQDPADLNVFGEPSDGR